MLIAQTQYINSWEKDVYVKDKAHARKYKQIIWFILYSNDSVLHSYIFAKWTIFELLNTFP